jgi:hypothetical protein
MTKKKSSSATQPNFRRQLTMLIEWRKFRNRWSKLQSLYQKVGMASYPLVMKVLKYCTRILRRHDGAVLLAQGWRSGSPLLGPRNGFITYPFDVHYPLERNCDRLLRSTKKSKLWLCQFRVGFYAMHCHRVLTHRPPATKMQATKLVI